jgi:hypothetical protein
MRQRASRRIFGMHSPPQGARNGIEWTPPHHTRWGFRTPTVGVVKGLRVLQANCRKSPDCTTTFLQKARGRGDVLLLQEFWADPRTDDGLWKLVQDSNFRYFFDGSIRDKDKKPRAMIALSVNPRVDFEVVRMERDMVALWVGRGDDRVMVVSLYNPNPDPTKCSPLRSRSLFQVLTGVRDWVVGGDFNAHHPIWSGKDDIRNAHETLELLDLGVLKIEPGTPTRRPDSNQEPTTIDLVIASTSVSGKISEAVIADEDLTTGSDHETLCWDISMGSPLVGVEIRRWKTRMPGDETELREWRKWWGEKADPREVPLGEVSDRFIEFLEERLGTKRIHPRSKKWWTPEINQAHLIMAQERTKLRNRTISNTEFRACRKDWFKTIRKAKRSSWESFLQEGKEDDIWKAISGKQSQLPMPQLVSASGQVADTENQKAELLTSISFPEDRAREDCPTIPDAEGGNWFCGRRKTLHASWAPGASAAPRE